MNNFENTRPVKTIEEFQIQLEIQLQQYYLKYLNANLIPEVTITKGHKFYKVITNGAVWGFIARKPFIHKGVPLKKGDLMKPAGWSQAAAYARGNVIEGTAVYGPYGPQYLN